MTAHDQKVRKQWLMTFIFCAVAGFIHTILLLWFDPVRKTTSATHYATMTSCALVASVAVYWILYRCIYKKPGTKVLYFSLVMTVVNILLNPVIIYKWPPHFPYAASSMWVSEVIGVVWLIVSWRMLQTNKRLKTLKPL